MKPWLVLAACLIVAALVLRGGCPAPDTPEGQRADTVLAERPAWADTVRRQDAAIDSLTAVIRRQADSVAEADRRARVAVSMGRAALADAERADSTAEESLDAMRTARDQWRRAALHYSQAVVPAFQSQMAAAARLQATTEAQRDSALTQRDEARRREAKTATALAGLREATRPSSGINVLGLHLPEWTDEVALGLGAGYVGYRVGRGSK